MLELTLGKWGRAQIAYGCRFDTKSSYCSCNIDSLELRRIITDVYSLACSRAVLLWRGDTLLLRERSAIILARGQSVVSEILFLLWY